MGSDWPVRFQHGQFADGFIGDVFGFGRQSEVLDDRPFVQRLIMEETPVWEKRTP